MKRITDLLIILLCCAWPCEAQSWFHRHRSEIIQDVLTITGRTLVTEASVRCQNISPTGCVEQGGVGLGAHPSSTATRAFGYSSAGLMVALNRIWHHETTRVKSDGKDDQDLEKLSWWWVSPLFIFDVVSAHDDWDAGTALKHPAPVPHYRK